MSKDAPPPGFVPPPAYNLSGPPPPVPPQQHQNVIIVPGTSFGSTTQPMTCPYCGSSISTCVESESNTKTHLFALLLCLVGCWCCAPIPYCMDSCLVQKHYCPSCRAFLGQSSN
ncbi:lipopolysaccharide-induced tumor necrosis factor-alpha factor homolog [Vespa crabro]|uniref:lipopolysaccharide-induced tumor necrosis factor-alpha factor homolog n=1 Tax=Vespa crabro TaxID=7445 RepID=UPI001F0043EE|nr:lipopolysaccharide-induced tumor necrosis factor-alpha factor homolog [Vespa crabro]XP_046823258.1 lipopolysaccharide-induced tumor necrosis factor-alpha factor homolog [Vespa crabro]XP_046823260.1 lipopolysaccharide-induced tumor necrosis factor-alpha factor homolog [Vespa crabro]XP_046823261.1 lipopolysaccharide-induced tumor necrosis factor-alpha factor homolog [Vespa crabro]XP_046823262.1 lipopolysaccharide-induced tumor necrosis factor-alpha factor homolog [Vespa crabro]